MTLITEAPRAIESGKEVLSQIGNFVATQTINVLNAGEQFVNWYLSRAAENPGLAQLTKFVHETSLGFHVNAGDQVDWGKAIVVGLFGASAGAAGGLLVAEYSLIDDNSLTVEERSNVRSGRAAAGSIVGGVAFFLVSIVTQSLQSK